MKTLQTPQLNLITPLPPNVDNTITFYYTDNQPVKNRAIITDNSTGQIIYDNINNTMSLSHIIPKHTLIAGKEYLIRIQVFDINNNSSNLSDPILFFCYNTPMFSIKDLPNKTVLSKANIVLSIEYSQSEGETLRSVQFFKYSNDKTIISQSPIIYTSNFSYEFCTLENNTTFFFRAIGETNHGISLDTGLIEVSTMFDTIPTNIVFTLDNIYCEGYIQFTSNIIIIPYKLENDNYKIEDGLLTLWDNSLTYWGFSIEGDFALFIEAKKLPVNKRFFTTSDNNISLSIIEACGEYYCRLTIKDSDYSLYAPFPTPILASNSGEIILTNKNQCIEVVSTEYDDDTLFVFELKRKGAYYTLKIYQRKEKKEENL